MFVYRLICRPTRRVYVGTSEYYPEINTLDVPKEVQADFDNFGKDNFGLFVICELNDVDKAIHKAEVLMGKEAIKYEITEKVTEEEPKYEIIQQFPYHPFKV
jgi:hypothetical protein